MPRRPPPRRVCPRVRGGRAPATGVGRWRPALGRWFSPPPPPPSLRGEAGVPRPRAFCVLRLRSPRRRRRTAAARPLRVRGARGRAPRPPCRFLLFFLFTPHRRACLWGVAGTRAVGGAARRCHPPPPPSTASPPPGAPRGCRVEEQARRLCPPPPWGATHAGPRHKQHVGPRPAGCHPLGKGPRRGWEGGTPTDGTRRPADRRPAPQMPAGGD